MSATGPSVYGVVGWPVAHSASPAIHAAAFEALGIPAIYLRLPVPPGRAARALEALRALGARGANVTAPHKTSIARLCDRLEPSAGAGSVNTLVIEDGTVVGHDTDADGLLWFLQRDAAVDLTGVTALVLGSGGAARACAAALSGRARRLVVAARNAAAGAEVADLFEGPVGVVPFAEAGRESGVDLILNATQLGWRDEDVPVAPRAGQVVVDLVYRETPMLRRARAAGAVAHDGRGMLLRQAALSFRLWTGLDAPRAAMLRGLDRALRPTS